MRQVSNLFLAINGLEKPVGFSVVHGSVGQSGDQLVEMIEFVGSGSQIIRLLFYAVGGDYLPVSKQANDPLLAYPVKIFFQQ